MKPLFLIIFAFSVFGVSAGGSYFAAQVKSFEFQKDQEGQFVVELALITHFSGLHVKQCDTLTVHGNFDSLKWKSYKRPMSPQAHKEALKYLARSVDQSILFGTLGNGLKRSANCHYQSKGLFIEGVDEAAVVFSVYDSI